MIVKQVGYATIVKIVIVVWSFVCFLGAAVWIGTADIFIPFKEPWTGAWAALGFLGWLVVWSVVVTPTVLIGIFLNTLKK